MKHTLLIVLVAASSAFAADLDVQVGATAALKSKKAVMEITVRDPSLVKVTLTDGAVSMVGQQSGVTCITVEYADGELERLLVVVGEGKNAPGMTAERAKTVKAKL